MEEDRGRRGAGKTQVFISVRPAEMVLGGKRGPEKEEAGWGRKSHDAWDGHNSSALRRRKNWAGLHWGVRGLAGDKRPTELNVCASLRRLNERLLYRERGRVKRTKERC